MAPPGGGGLPALADTGFTFFVVGGGHNKACDITPIVDTLLPQPASSFTPVAASGKSPSPWPFDLAYAMEHRLLQENTTTIPSASPVLWSRPLRCCRGIPFGVHNREGEGMGDARDSLGVQTLPALLVRGQV